jgi:hypothetical protein
LRSGMIAPFCWISQRYLIMTRLSMSDDGNGAVLRNYWRRASTAGFPTNDYALAGAVASKYS